MKFNADQEVANLCRLIGRLMDIHPSAGSLESDLLRNVAEAVHAYESKRYPFPKPTMAEMKKFRESETRKGKR